MAEPLKPEELTKSVWKGWSPVVSTFNRCSLEDVMSEQLALELSSPYKVEPDTIGNIASEVDIPEGLLLDDMSGEDTSNDLMLATMLQFEFDSEYDKRLKIVEEKHNRGSKVAVSYNNFRTIHPALRDEVDIDEDLFNVPDVKIIKDTTPSFNKQGISGRGKNIVTKHDPDLSSKRNVIKALDMFPPEFDTGNSLDFDMRLPNKVFNKLKISSVAETKRHQRTHEKKEHSTQLCAVDEKTKLALYKLTNNGTLAQLNGIISTGKESIVFHADAGSMPERKLPLPKEFAVKVFKTTLGTFKNRCLYVKGDQRFIKDDFKRQNPRKIMRIWAEKEEMNLKRMNRYNMPCPEPIVLKNHVLVMSFIGRGGEAAPRLATASLSEKELADAYKQCVQIMKTMYLDCKLVHADLSEFNLLWFDGTVYVIDVAQAVDSFTLKAPEFLVRDCQNITTFFKKRGLADELMSWQELFNSITGMNITGEGEEFLSKIIKKTDDEATLRLDRTKVHFPFDSFFERSCQERKMENDDDGDDNDNDDDEDESKSEGTDD